MQKRVSRIKRWRGEKKKIMFGSEGRMLMWNLPGEKKKKKQRRRATRQQEFVLSM